MRKARASGGQPTWGLRSAVLVLVVLGTTPGLGAVEIRLVDDLGGEIGLPIQLCTINGLERECRSVGAGGEAVDIGQVDLITAESTGHGPVSARPGELLRDDSGIRMVTLPRKAILRVENLPQEGAKLSVYRATDPSFRRPLSREELSPDARGFDEIMIPSGPLVASISTPKTAPDLRLLSLEPGSAYRFARQEAEGWSLVLRILEKASGEAIDDAEVEIGATPGYGTPGALSQKARGGLSGLVLFSGIRAPIAVADVRSSGFLEVRVAGLSASPGTFAFRQVPLQTGGALRAEIRLSGEPATGAVCEIRKDTRPEPGEEDDPSHLVSATEADKVGICRAQAVPRGSYRLRVRPVGTHEEGEADFVQPLLIEEGLTTDLLVDLRPMVVRGTVTRGDEPVSEFDVEVSSLEGSSPRTHFPPRLGRAATNEDGDYAIVLWSPCDCIVWAMAKDGTVADFTRVSISDEEEVVDFRLAEQDLQGVVVDGNGNPVSGASVVLKWVGNSLKALNSMRIIHTREDGSFTISLEDGGGEAELSAGKEGYGSSEDVPLTILSDVMPGPQTLILTKVKSLAGTLVVGSGLPIAGARITSFERPEGAPPSYLGEATTDEGGSFEVPRARGTTTMVVLSGPGCPLEARDVHHSADEASAKVDLACSPVPGSLSLLLEDREGSPYPNASVSLLAGSTLVPDVVLQRHLQDLGLPAATDGSGRLALVGLAPGEYSVYLASASNPYTISTGQPHGFLTSARLDPLSTVDLQITLEGP